LCDGRTAAMGGACHNDHNFTGFSASDNLTGSPASGSVQ
jgi:hypothetical protein